MKFTISLFLLIATLFVLNTLSSYSQQGLFSVDAISLPSTCPDSGVVVLSSEFSNQMIPFFAKNSNSTSSKEFSSLIQLQFEIRDSLGIIRKRIVFKDTIEADIKEETLSNDIRHTKSHRLTLQKGFYTISALLQDQNGKLIKRQEVRSQMVQSQLMYVGTPTPNSDKVEVIDFWSSPTIASPSFTEKVSESLYIQISSGGKLPYKHRPIIVTAQCSYSNSKQEYEYSVELLGNKVQLEKLWSWKVPPISGKSEAKRYELVFDESNPSAPIFQKVDISVPNFKCNVPIPSLIQIRGMIEFPLPVSSLIPGTYKLTIKSVGNPQMVERYFEISTFHQAQSLKNSKSAVAAMYHLLSDKELNNLEVASDYQRWEFINAYWRKLDPTPTTSFNEAQMEYFRRADIARTKFAAINQKDGVLTDFGKILVLYGEPTSEQTIKDETNIEIIRWSYSNNVQKQFDFKKSANGLYTLLNYSELSSKK
ncbi:MAG: GWxTD domain-containing protein [Candidatus Kapabacteria bacterium]|nr:GWxTD domain-containing protein [Candidatus Kapabacteria bacterium]